MIFQALKSKKNKGEKKNNKIALLLLFLISCGFSTPIFSQTNNYTGATGGNWSIASNWSLGLVPTLAHDVVIPDNKNVTVDSNAVCNTFTIKGGGNTNTITISGSNSLTVTGAVSIEAPTANSKVKSIAVGTGTLTCASIAMATTTANSRDCRVTTTTGTVNVSGNITMVGVAARNQVSIDGIVGTGGTLNIGGSLSGGDFLSTNNNSTVNFNGTLAQIIPINADYIYNNLVINNSAGATLQAKITTSNVKGDINVQSGILNNGGFAITGNTGKIFTVANGATLILSGSAFPSGFGTNTLGATSTVEYSGTGAQNVAALTYGNLTISGSGTKTAAGNITANNDFTLNAGNFKLNNATNYTLTINGDYLQTGGIFDFNTGTSGTSIMNLSGNLTNTNTVLSSLTTVGAGTPNGNIVFNGTGLQVINIPTAAAADWVNYSINPGSNVALSSNLLLTGENTTNGKSQVIISGTLDLGTYTITAASTYPDGAAFTLNSGATLITANALGINGSVSSTNTTRVFNTDANYVFNGTLAQVTSTGMPATVNHLTFSNTTGVTLAQATIITNDFSITSGAIANLGTFTHTAGGLLLGGEGTVPGSWGSTSSPATNKNDTYFAATTGIVSNTCTAPIITTQPVPLVICATTGGSFSVVTSASSPTYQWQYSGDNINWINIDSALDPYVSGYTTATFTLTNTPAAWTNNYVRCVIWSSGRCRANSNSVLLTVNPMPTAPIIGTITPLTCAVPMASVVLNGLPSGSWTINQSGTAVTTYTGSGTTYTVSGLVEGSYAFSVTSGSCTSGTSSNVVINPLATNTWNGTSWSLGTPTPDQNIVFAGNYSIATNVEGCSCNLTSGTITIPSGNTLTLTNAITGSAMLTLENNASLIQTNAAAVNTASIIVKRNSTPIIHDDFTYWSSPTTGTQTLFDFSPTTQDDKFFSYHNDWANENPSTKTFDKGIGYAIRAEYGDATAVVRLHQFTGVPNNGTINMPVAVRASCPYMGFGELLTGNPYPSTLDADAFIDANLVGTGTINQTISGTLYFWTHNHTLTGNDYDGNDYATYTKLGGTAVGAGPSGSGNTSIPTKYVATGQGFFVDFEADGNITFNNAMRVGTNNTNFYKQTSSKRTLASADRIWLNLTNSTINFSQALVGYVDGATNDYDPGFDGRSYGGAHDLYSVLDAEILTIQAKAQPFVDSDSFLFGYSVTVAGNTTITLDRVDGVFLGSQAIYLEDKLLNVTHDIKASPYSFNSAIGTFEDRFVLKFSNVTLGNEDFDSLENKVLVSTKNKQIKINSYAEIIDRVSVYDLLGRQVYQKTNVNSNELSIANLVSSRQTLIVKTRLQTGETVTDKIIF